MKTLILKRLFIYLLFVLTGIGNSSSFAFSPVSAFPGEAEVLKQDHHNLPIFSEEIEGTLLLQVSSGKQLGNQGKITAYNSPGISGPEVVDEEEPSVFLQLQKILLKQYIFPFHFFW